MRRLLNLTTRRMRHSSSLMSFGHGSLRLRPCPYKNRYFGLFWVLLVIVGVLVGGCNLGAPAITPSPTPEIPAAEFLFPDNNSRVEMGAVLTIDIVARDRAQGISRVELLVDDVIISEATPVDNAPPIFRVTMNWLAEGIGLHTLKAIAYRADGTASDETIIIVEVVPPLT